MVSPIPICKAVTTGRLSVRRGLFGSLVLLVEERLDYSDPFDRDKKVTRTEHRWRDARLADVVHPMVILQDREA